jgi:hypothetical protein
MSASQHVLMSAVWLHARAAQAMLAALALAVNPVGQVSVLHFANTGVGVGVVVGAMLTYWVH